MCSCLIAFSFTSHVKCRSYSLLFQSLLKLSFTMNPLSITREKGIASLHNNSTTKVPYTWGNMRCCRQCCKQQCFLVCAMWCCVLVYLLPVIRWQIYSLTIAALKHLHVSTNVLLVSFMLTYGKEMVFGQWRKLMLVNWYERDELSQSGQQHHLGMGIRLWNKIECCFKLVPPPWWFSL